MTVEGQDGFYDGEINAQNKAHGKGKFVSENGNTWSGIFQDGKAEGYIYR